MIPGQLSEKEPKLKSVNEILMHLRKTQEEYRDMATEELEGIVSSYESKNLVEKTISPERESLEYEVVKGILEKRKRASVCNPNNSSI